MEHSHRDQSRWIKLVEVIARLRAPNGGCPWDLEQSHLSLVPYLVEETFELAEAIEKGNERQIIEELGDVLLQVVLHSQLAQDRGRFSIEDVINELTAKMIRRHPHVFSDAGALTTEEVLTQWGEIKAKEKVEAGSEAETSDSSQRAPFRFAVPLALPALSRAAKIGSQTKKLRFDWPNWRGAMEKVSEELKELQEALDKSPEPKTVHSPNLEPPGPTRDPIAQELGDLLFAISQLARHRGLDPEQCLRQANARFENRFQRMLSEARDLERSDGRSFESRSNEEIEKIWQTAKQKAREAQEE